MVHLSIPIPFNEVLNLILVRNKIFHRVPNTLIVGIISVLNELYSDEPLKFRNFQRINTKNSQNGINVAGWAFGIAIR